MNDTDVAAVLKAVSKLHYRERKVLSLRYGIEAEPMSPTKVAEYLHISKGRARQSKSRPSRSWRRSNER